MNIALWITQSLLAALFIMGASFRFTMSPAELEALSGMPYALLAFISVCEILGGIGLIVWRRAELRSEARLDSLLSREAVFLFQNLVLVAMVFVIFWVTFFPLISEAITGTKVSVGPPAFRPFIVPLALVLERCPPAGNRLACMSLKQKIQSAAKPTQPRLIK